jgi:glycosyltransferase involved in cell wall biosynthesis
VPQHKREGRRLTVLHISQPVDGGVARVVTDLVRSQTLAGLRVLVACPPGGVLGEAAAAAGAGVLPWPARREPGRHLARETLRLARLVRRTAPDLVHAHSAKAGLAGRLAVRGRIPTVFQPHAWSFEAVRGRTRELALHWERFAARWATCVLCVSEDERRRGLEAGVPARWAVLRNGVDTDRFRPPAPPGLADLAEPAVRPDESDVPVLGELAHSPGLAKLPDLAQPAHRAHLDHWAQQAHLAQPPVYPAEPAESADPAGKERARAGLPALRGLPPQTPLVVCVGRLCRQKGQDVLLRAWPDVTAAVPGARLALVGDGPARDALHQAAPPHVMFAGETADPAPWYAAADLVVLPSRWEGMALAPLEAMACGRPVVLSEVSGARESLPPGHAARCLVPPEDAPALARAVAALLAEPRLRDTLGRQAQEHVRATYDVRRTAAAVTRLYHQLLGPGPSGLGPPDGAAPHARRGPVDRPGPSPDSREHITR